MELQKYFSKFLIKQRKKELSEKDFRRRLMADPKGRGFRGTHRASAPERYYLELCGAALKMKYLCAGR